MGLLNDIQQAKRDLDIDIAQLNQTDPDMLYAANLRVEAAREKYDLLCKRAKREMVEV